MYDVLGSVVQVRLSGIMERESVHYKDGALEALQNSPTNVKTLEAR
jgi:hypothetical protein